MAREIKTKKLENTRLATNYGGWIYCTKCNKNIGYLCYVTYDWIKLEYYCNCGSHGSVAIDFIDSKEGVLCNSPLIVVKNRFCCPNDESPLVTILEKNVESYTVEIACKNCSSVYKNSK